MRYRLWREPSEDAQCQGSAVTAWGTGVRQVPRRPSGPVLAHLVCSGPSSQLVPSAGPARASSLTSLLLTPLSTSYGDRGLLLSPDTPLSTGDVTVPRYLPADPTGHNTIQPGHRASPVTSSVHVPLAKDLEAPPGAAESSSLTRTSEAHSSVSVCHTVS